jgi:GDP-4-dehydro-6-deoxy-D-mannose reductase
MADRRVAERYVVTGASGFIGSNLATLIERERPDATVVRVARTPPRAPGWLEAELQTTSGASRLLSEASPDYVIHCAGAGAGNDPDVLFAANVRPALSLLEAVAACGTGARMVLLGSAAEYGATAMRMSRLTEDLPCEPLTPYGLSKLWQTEAVAMWARRGVNALCARVFNVVGPGMPSHLSIGSFALQLTEMARSGSPTVLRTGNLAPRRDFLAVDDACRALLLLASGGVAGGVYNVASGESIAIGAALDALARGAGLSPRIEQLPELVRANDLPDVVGDYSRLQEATGWKPERTALEALEAMGRTLR